MVAELSELFKRQQGAPDHRSHGGAALRGIDHRSVVSAYGARPSFLALLAMMVTASQGQTTKVIDVTDARPLWAALDALEVTVGGAINYEDPPYENEADVQDFSTPQQRAGAPAWWRLVGPREGNVTAEVQVPAAGKAADNDVIFHVNLLLASYRQNELRTSHTRKQSGSHAHGRGWFAGAKILNIVILRIFTDVTPSASRLHRPVAVFGHSGIKL
jgi:hypothetical protein